MVKMLQKIAVCGKGGSGKSVTVTLLAHGLLRIGRQALVIDADESNTGLHRLLGFDRVPRPLIDLMGGKQKVEAKLLERIAAGESEISIQLFRDEIRLVYLSPEYMLAQGNLRLVSVGKILMALEGCACPMGIVSRSFLHKLRLDENEVAVVDLEAGVEHFGRGVETGVDGVLVVVEPSVDSLEVAEKIFELSTNLKIGDIWAVLNKVQSDAMAAKLQARLERKSIPIAGIIHYDAEVFEACLEGRPVTGISAAADIDKVLDNLFP
jgi:CO dehydrogenase maturation factor